jgi:ABC-type transport system involved in multi-copper enzyme maturation permease subunit
MNWLAWQQHRKQFLIAGIFVVLFAAFMIPTGISFWHTYQHALSSCNATATCDQLAGELFQSSIDALLFHLVPVAIMFIPILLGLFWGVPLLSKEYTEGTNKLVWTQSVSRRKWLSVKLAWVLIGTAITAGAFAALDTWWSKTGNLLNVDRFQPLQFSSQGIVPVACAIFAVSLGIMFGAWFKRIMVALGVTLFLLIAIALVIVPNFIRPNYVSPTIYTAALFNNSTGEAKGDPLSPQAPPNSGASLVVSGSLNSETGHPISWSNPPQSCIVAHPNDGIGPIGQHTAIAVKNGNVRDAMVSRNGGPTVDLNCLDNLGYHWITKYQPSYRYWDFQRIETGFYLALSVIPLGLTYWLVLRRDA